jgi:MFS family permease
VAQLLSAPSWGRVSDRYGRRPAILLGLLVSASGYVVFAFAGTIALLLVSRIVQGLGGGTVGVLQAYVSDASAAEDRARSLGWLSAATSAGVVVGPAVGSLLTAAWGRHAPGLGSAALCLCVSAFAWRFLRESKGMRLTGEHTTSLPITGRAALWRVVTHAGTPPSRLIWIYTLAIGAFYGTIPLLPLLLAGRFGVTERTAGYYIMYFGAMGVVVRAGLLGWFVRRLREARLARFGLLLLAAGLAALASSYGTVLLFASFTLMTLGTAFVFPCITALLSRVVRSRDRGLYMGVQQTFGGVSRVAFPLAAGLAVDRFGVGVPFGLAAVLVLLTLLLTTSLERYLTPSVDTAVA